MSNVKFSFRFNRHGHVKNSEMFVPSSVPPSDTKKFISIMIRREYPEAHDLVITQEAKSFTSVECGGLPDNIETVSAGY